MTPVEPRTMSAWAVRDPGPIEDRPLDLVTKPVPTTGPGESLVRVDACGGQCRLCLRGAENLCPYSHYTGSDADGGYASTDGRTPWATH
jgi:D-arabinose 1-dehydrogenase-like Zn-dependent alcohol dehydrogenase